jgi:tRNA(adenine34) deaminase
VIASAGSPGEAGRRHQNRSVIASAGSPGEAGRRHQNRSVIASAASPGTDEGLIRIALAVAATAGPRDVPIGAVVVAADGTELARAVNARETLGDPTAHAEVLALRAAAGVLGDGWRLEGATLAVTVEPCTMCAGALVLARVERLVFGAWEPKTGAVGSLWDVVRDRRLNHRPEVRGGVLATECAAPLEAFFARQRLG